MAAQLLQISEVVRQSADSLRRDHTAQA